MTMKGGTAICVLLLGLFVFYAKATNITCDFDDGNFCSWTPQDIRMKWNINEPYKARNSMPKFDHTTGNYNGRYAYVNGDEISVKKSSLGSAKVPEYWGNGMCFSFWYFMNTDRSGSLTVAADRVGKKEGYFHEYWKKQGNFGYRWRHSYVNIETNVINPQLNITAALLSGTIAIDDLEVKNGTCPPEKECTFDGGDMCNYGQDVNNTHNWVLKKATDDVQYPILDHTTNSNSGHYLYVAFNGSDETPIQKARISTPQRPVTDGSCITFYYHIHNISKLSLNTYVSTDNGLTYLQWSASQSQGLLWHGVRFTIVSPTSKWQVIFEAAVRGEGYGQVALDDIEIASGACSPPGFCDFEGDNCLWENVRGQYRQETEELGDIQHADMVSDDFDWVRHIAEDYYGPSVDHTLGSPEGFYLILDPRYQKFGERAVYLSERLTSHGTSCFTFWYALPNEKNGAQLRVFVSSDFQKGESLQLYKDGTNGDWKEARITLNPKTTVYWIYLAGYVGYNILGYAAVDDLAVTYGDCSGATVEPPTNTSNLCPPDTFKCIEGNVKCIPITWRCDCVYDCADGSDEDECGEICLSTRGATVEPPTNTSNLCPPENFKCIEGNVKCIPITWRCNCVYDCADGSDEDECGGLCLTTRATTPISPVLKTTSETYPETTLTPKGRCNDTQKLCTDEKTCIPGILLCDGVPDCPDGSDEAYCPGELRCEEGFYFCQDKMIPPCLHRGRICDGKYDCSDGSDESLCGVCPKDYCQNKGICSLKAKVPVCKCPSGYEGNRCWKENNDGKKEENKIGQMWSFNFNGSFHISWSKIFLKDYK